MNDITNADRSGWAAEAIDAFTAVCPMNGEDNQTKAKDLATNLFHYLRLECGLDMMQARNVMDSAIAMAETEAEEDSDGEEIEEPPVIKYGVRFWATFRACAEVEIEARDEDHLKEQIRNYDWTDLDFFRNTDDFTRDGDETATVYGPDEGDDDPWAVEYGIELDLRESSGPFSWVADQIVKDLAAFKDKGWGSADLVPLINKAHEACQKDT